MTTIEVNATKIAYQRSGAGEPVVLLHSSACSGAQWSALARLLAEDYQVFAPDLRGYGHSDPWPDHRPLRLADEAAAIEALAETCGRPIHLVGHSYGGAVALKVAAQRRVPLSSLTLIEPVAFHVLDNGAPQVDPLFVEVLDLAYAVRTALSCGDRRAAMAHFVEYWNGAGAWSRLSPEQQARILEVAPKVPHDFHAAITEAARLEDYGRITVPTLLLSGTESPEPVRRVATLLAATLPDVWAETVAGAGHMLPLSHREPVNCAIAEHIDRYREIELRAA